MEHLHQLAIVWQIKLIVVAICALLGAFGGLFLITLRRDIMPPILTAELCLITLSLWQLSTLLVIIPLHLAYKRFGTGNFARAVWIIVCAIVISTGLVLTNHLYLWLAVLYCIISAVLCGIFNNRLKQFVGDLIFYGWLGVIVFLVH